MATEAKVHEANGRQVDLFDYAVAFTVRGGPNDGKVHKADLLELKLVCEEIEAKHQIYEKLAAGDKRCVTADFLAELAANLSRHGIPDCSTSMANEVWAAVTNAYGQLKKNMQEPQNSPDSTDSTPGNSAPNSDSDSTPTSPG